MINKKRVRKLGRPTKSLIEDDEQETRETKEETKHNGVVIRSDLTKR